MVTALGIALIVLAVALVVCVLMQQGKEKSLSGSIAGSAESFVSNGKVHTKGKMLSRITTVLAILFTILVVVTYIVAANQ